VDQAPSLGPAKSGDAWQLARRQAGHPGGRAIAAIWGGLSAAAIRRGRPPPASDTWVAACCLACQLPLANLNLKDFKNFAEHHGLWLLEP
jgi:predicted nucleic acid-binding protein